MTVHIYRLGSENKPSIIISSDHDFNNTKTSKLDPRIYIYTPQEFIGQFKSRTKEPPTKPRDLQFGMNHPLDFQLGREQGFGRQR